MTAGTYTIRVNKELMFFEPITVKIAPNTPQLPDVITAGYVQFAPSISQSVVVSERWFSSLPFISVSGLVLSHSVLSLHVYSSLIYLIMSCFALLSSSCLSLVVSLLDLLILLFPQLAFSPVCPLLCRHE